MNPDKWIKTLPKQIDTSNTNNTSLDYSRWENTIPKVNKTKSSKKYFMLLSLFIFGLISVSVIKNETRNLQKEVNKLEAVVKSLKIDLHQATLDHEVITSPENVMRLAKEHLDSSFQYYKKSQIKKFGEKQTEEFQLNYKKENKIKNEISKKIKKNKEKIKTLQKMVQQPENIPNQVKTELARKIEENKLYIKKIYNSPAESINFEKMQRWGTIQVVKVLLGIPIVPGK